MRETKEKSVKYGCDDKQVILFPLNKCEKLILTKKSQKDFVALCSDCILFNLVFTATPLSPFLKGTVIHSEAIKHFTFFTKDLFSYKRSKKEKKNHF